jgi:3-deoxy-D-manno-octulosonic-acid transferase
MPTAPEATPFGLKAWSAIARALEPFAPLLLHQRAARGKEDPIRRGERMGYAARPRPDGRLVWLHGASVGESLAALPLVSRLMADGFHVLVTSGTVTSATLLAQRLPAGAIHHYVPLDTPNAVARFLDHWKPEAGLFVESDLWPNLIGAARARGVKLALVNARVSARSARNWQRAPKMAAALLSAFDLILAQDEEIAARFRAIGAPNVTVVGSLKADAPPLAADLQALTLLQEMIGGRKLLIAAQTHAGEDETILPAHDLLRAQFPDLLTIIVPRHPARGAAIAMLCGSRGAARRALGDTITPATSVYIADTLGELGTFYQLAPFCFIGATLVPKGGHNPLEPALLGCAILAGPHRVNASSAFAAILDAQGFGSVNSSSDIAREAARLLSDPESVLRAGEAARTGAATLQGAVDKTVTLLRGVLADART